jgi:hypothetical protein
MEGVLFRALTDPPLSLDTFEESAGPPNRPGPNNQAFGWSDRQIERPGPRDRAAQETDRRAAEVPAGARRERSKASGRVHPDA